MKIGILTFHRAINYGAVLQCFALYKTLLSMGNEVEIIDYRPWFIEKYRKLFEKKDFQSAGGGWGKLRYLFSCASLIFSKKKTVKKFDLFLSKNMRYSDKFKNDNVSTNYDLIIFGSDQIWSPETCNGLDSIYMGQFPKNNMKFISYAASVGKLETIQGKLATVFHNNLNAFDTISVREENLHLFLKHAYNIESNIVCDPSLLLQSKDYMQISQECNEDNFVLLFDLTDDNKAYNFAKRIAHQLNAKVIELKAVMNPFRKRNYMRTEISPEQFIGYINKARCIITNSFHATSFSIIFQKDFYTLKRNSNNERSRTLLSKVGLLERIVKTDEIVNYSPIDYISINSKIESFRTDSTKFIFGFLEEL